MRHTDRFLIGIVAGIILLVTTAFVATLLRPQPTYLAEDQAENVAHNYFLALQQQDYPRAYGYLSPTLEGYPFTVEKFARQIADNYWQFQSLGEPTAREVQPARLIGDSAFVAVRETRYASNGLFGGGQYNNTFEVRLQREQGAWKLLHSDSYWVPCWTSGGGNCD
ncbi:MAG: hypothetical protein WCF84_26055 [Anaerolineae bacterium]